MSEIVLTGVSKRWGAARAVENITLSAAAGELLVLLGPSGCGKSTTLRVIAGLEEVDAGTIIAEAPVCLMDEPLSNLDAKLRHEMRTEIRALQQRLGMTMIYVTHDQTEAMTMADRIVLMRDGRIEQNALPKDLYNRPATAFAARFIGMPAMNLLPGDDVVLLGIRPEHLRVVARGGTSAKITAVEHLGAESLVMCEIGGHPASFRQEGFSPWHPEI